MSKKSYDWREDPYFSVVPPLYLGVMHGFKNADEGTAIFKGEKKGYAYGRVSNPTVDMFQNWLAELEGGERCWATNTGLLALLFLVLALVDKKKEVVTSPYIYGGSYHQFHLLRERGFKISFIENPFSLDSWNAAINLNTALIFLETPSNPTVDVFDIKAIADVVHCRNKDALLVVDNTMGITLQKPFEFGADIVLHSVTKYLNRQSTGLGGAVVSSKAVTEKYGEKMDDWFIHSGMILHPLTAWLCLNNRFTLERDMVCFSQNACELAAFLNRHPKVGKVYYPCLPESPHFKLAFEQMPNGCGGLLAFELKDYNTAKKFVNSLKLTHLAPHLGDSRYLAIHPASTTHSRLSDKELGEANIKKNLVRVSAGLEPVEPIIEEFRNILKKL